MIDKKYCPKCKEVKDHTCFGKHVNRNDGLQPHCKMCVSDYHAERYKSDTSVKRRQRSNNYKNILIKREFVNQYKSSKGCLFCGEKEPVALDLHHLDPKIKDSSVSRMLGNSIQTIMSEIAKCVVICSNCHRKHHAGVSGYEIDIAH